MKKTKYLKPENIFTSLFSLLALIVIVLSHSSCNDDLDGKTFVVSDDIMIDEYITQKDPSMSTFLEIVDKTGFRGMIHAYGTYTCFIPTNDAIDAYAKQKGKSSWKDFSDTELENMVKFHIVNDTLQTSDFVDGRLPSPTLLKKYLTTATESSGTTASIRVNRQGVITVKDIRCANGYINKVDEVLSPNQSTLADEVSNLPETYSLFKTIMKETGWIDSLSVSKTDVWRTVLLQSDNSFQQAGISSKADLLKYLAKELPEITSQKTLLWTYAAYHCLNGLYYVADLSMLSALQTAAPNQVLTFKNSNDSLLVNEYKNVTAGIYEKGVPVLKSSKYTDYSCDNGVLIDLGGYVGPVVRPAMAVYWDLAEQPEIMKLKEFRKKGVAQAIDMPLDNFSEMKFEIRNSAYTSIQYCTEAAYNAKTAYAYYDNLQVNFNRITSMSMQTPLLTEGTYNVWLCWRRAGYGDKIKGVFEQDGKDDQALSNIVDLSEYFDTATAAESLLAAGMKRYTAKERNSTMNARLMGTIVVEATGRHWLKFVSVNQAKASNVWLDMVQFIPVDNDQLWPRFDVEGNTIYKGTDCENIAPTNLGCSADNDAR